MGSREIMYPEYGYYRQVPQIWLGAIGEILVAAKGHTHMKDERVVNIQRVQYFFFMSIINVRKKKLGRFQRCLLFMRAYNLTNISDISKQYIVREKYQRKPHKRKRTWTNQAEPSH